MLYTVTEARTNLLAMFFLWTLILGDTSFSQPAKTYVYQCGHRMPSRGLAMSNDQEGWMARFMNL